jgi:hypothetical protein
MKRAIRRRLFRAHQNIPPVPPDLSAMSPQDQILWVVKQVGLKALLGAYRKTEEPAAMTTPEPERAPEPPPEVAPPPAPIETKPAPRPPRHAGEPDPAAVPPENQWWQTMCWFRFRGLNEPYDDEPEQDELDELIYDSRS